jgi:glyceraldehyde 3-phosphate dehydrogenase
MKVAINGFGRIGRNILRAIYESGNSNNIEVVAINDLGSFETNAHLLKYDTTHGIFSESVAVNENQLTVNENEICFLSERDPQALPWRELGVGLVFECTGIFKTRELANKHIEAGAAKVLVSAPGKNLDASVVFGVNHEILTAQDSLVSNASCTTNCLAHVCKALLDSVGIEHGIATTIHAMTNTQRILDAHHKDPRRARSASESLIPTTTGSAKAIGQIMPELNGKLSAVSVRVPTTNVSLLDLSCTVSKKITIQSVNAIFSDYQKSSNGLLELSELPLVSIDYNHHPASAIVDAQHTYVEGNLIKIMAWYDNEWAYSNRMIETATYMMSL